MNNTFIFEDLNKKKNEVILNLKKMYESSSDLKRFFELSKKMTELDLKIQQIKPFYLKEKMAKCNHLFIKCSYKHFDSNNDKYILFIDHYCLKCGCSTKKLDAFYLKENGILNLPTFYVSHNDQIEIIENAKNYEVIDFNETDLYNLIIKWEKLKEKYKNIEFFDLVEKFISKNEVKDLQKNGEKIYEFKYLND